jgi:hypothetical protein
VQTVSYYRANEYGQSDRIGRGIVKVRAYTPQRLRIDAAADADTVLAGKINLDCLCDGRRRIVLKNFPVEVQGVR